MANLAENRYRDFLAGHLEIIEPGLQLVDSEMLLANTEGAKGFVDLVARDKFDVLVLIEIKRSDSAARTALHELFKYMALFRKNHGLATHQIRCILLSTMWHELIVPFTDLVDVAPFELNGKMLYLDTDDNPASTADVDLAEAINALTICPKHDILLYAKPEDRAKDLDRIKEALVDAGVDDFYLIHMDHDGSNPHVIQQYALYLVISELSQRQRASVKEARDLRWRELDAPGNEDDAEVDLDDDEPMDAESWEHEEEVFTWVHAATRASTSEIGYPDKLRQVLDTWEPAAFTRAGRFHSNLLWPDQSLISAAVSDGGQYTTVFVEQVSTSNKIRYSRMLKNLTYSLVGAKGWKKQVPELLKVVQMQQPNASVSVYIFSPCDVLWALAALPSGEDGYLPWLEIVVESDYSSPRIFIGALEWDRSTKLASSTGMSDLFPDGHFHYHLQRHLGEQWTNETRLCQFHGLQYALYEVIQEDGRRRFARIKVNSSEMSGTDLTNQAFREQSVYAFAAYNAEYLERLSREMAEPYGISPY